MLKLFYMLVLLLLFSSCNKAQINSPMLWKISHNKTKLPSYIFGTFHTRDPKINKLPKSVTASLAKTQRLYTEITMGNKSTNKILDFSKATPPISLKQRLHPKTIKLLLAYLKTHKLPYSLSSLRTYKTWSIALMLSNALETAKYSNTEYMDEALISLAKTKQIKHMGIEDPIEQLSYFDALPHVLQEQLLLDTLKQEENQDYTNALKAWYIKGSQEGFLSLQKQFSSNNPKQKRLDKALNQGLLIERNSKFIRRIDILLQHNQDLSYFFAIGAGHMSGEKGIIQGLKELGYAVKKLD